jgi:hypothetical protein
MCIFVVYFTRIASNDRMTSEWTGKDLEGSSGGLTGVLSRHVDEETEEKMWSGLVECSDFMCGDKELIDIAYYINVTKFSA